MRVADAIDLAITLFSCFIYIVGTYLEQDRFIKEPLWIIEVCTAALPLR